MEELFEPFGIVGGKTSTVLDRSLRIGECRELGDGNEELKIFEFRESMDGWQRSVEVSSLDRSPCMLKPDYAAKVVKAVERLCTFGGNVVACQ